MLGDIEGRRRRERQMLRWLDGITDSVDMGLVKLLEPTIQSEISQKEKHQYVY